MYTYTLTYFIHVSASASKCMPNSITHVIQYVKLLNNERSIIEISSLRRAELNPDSAKLLADTTYSKDRKCVATTHIPAGLPWSDNERHVTGIYLTVYRYWIPLFHSILSAGIFRNSVCFVYFFRS